MLHTQEWEALIEEVATADVGSADCDGDDVEENDYEDVDLGEAEKQGARSPEDKGDDKKETDEPSKMEVLTDGKEADAAVDVNNNELKQESVERMAESEVHNQQSLH